MKSKIDSRSFFAVSAVIRHRLAQRIIDHLKGINDSDASFRHFVKIEESFRSH